MYFVLFFVVYKLNMYHQAWPWAATATPTATSGFVPPTASTPVATTQWPAGYSQYTVTPEIQQQWAAAWATQAQAQAQYAYNANVPVGGDPQTTAAAAAAFTGAYPDYQTAASAANETKKPGDVNSAPEKPKTTPEQVSVLLYYIIKNFLPLSSPCSSVDMFICNH